MRSWPRCCSASAAVAGRRSRCRCWRPRSTSTSPSTWADSASSRRWASPASRACWTARASRIAPQDGYACILPYSDRNWQDFYDFTGRTEFQDDPRFRAPARSGQTHPRPLPDGRGGSGQAHDRRVGRLLRSCQHSLHAGAVSSADLPDDPHLKAGGAVRDRRASDRRPLSHCCAAPVSFSAAPFRIRRHAPRLGQHTAEVLAEVGFSEAEIAQLTTPAELSTLTPALSRQGRGSLESPLPSRERMRERCFNWIQSP